MPLIPTRRLAVVAFVVALALLAYPGTEVPVWISVLGITAVLVLVGVIDSLIGTSPRHLVVLRRHPPVVVVGQSSTIDWEVRSESRRSLRIHVADELAASLQPGISRFTVRIPPGSVAKVSTPMRPLRRGRFALSTLVVRIEGPLGLGSRQRSIPLRTTLRVHPRFRSRKDAELKVRRARRLEVGLRSVRGLGGGTEFEQLREYGPDDEFRRIDWTATARAGRAIVRTYRAERNQSVIIMLDNGRVMAGRVEGVPRVEHAMDAAMMLGTVSTRLGDRCGLVAFDREIRSVLPPGRHSNQVGKLTEAMFDLEPELSESDYREAFAQVVARFRRRAMLVLLTDLQEQAVRDSLLPALPLVLRTHLVVLAGVRDPMVESWASGVVHDDEEAYRQVAAVEALAQRDATAARLRGLGVTVIDAPAGRLASQLADAYLLVKSTGRL